MTTQTSDEGLGIPFSERCICNEPFAFPTAATQWRHVGFDSSFINEDKLARPCPNGWQSVFMPFITFATDVSAFSLRCQQRFLKLKPALHSNLDKLEGSAVISCSCSNQLAKSGMVMSGRASICAMIAERQGPSLPVPFGRPIQPGSIEPVSSRRFCQCTADEPMV